MTTEKQKTEIAQKFLTGRRNRDWELLDEHLATVFSLRAGNIFAIATYLSDVEMVNAFFVAI